MSDGKIYRYQTGLAADRARRGLMVLAYPASCARDFTSCEDSAQNAFLREAEAREGDRKYGRR
jgi:hypothetical protein